MKYRTLASLVALSLISGPLFSAQAAPKPTATPQTTAVAAPAPAVNPADVVPDAMPNNTPYGTPIALDHAKQLITAAEAEAKKRGWAMNIAVYDSGANLVAFERMDGAQLGSIEIAEHKARFAVKLRRPSHAVETAVQTGNLAITTLDGFIASRGGIPLIQNGKLIGAIGCSGGTGSQDEVVCMAAANMVK